MLVPYQTVLVTLRVVILFGLLASVVVACGRDHSAIQAQLVGKWLPATAPESHTGVRAWEFLSDGTFKRILYDSEMVPALNARGTYAVRDVQTITLQFQDLGTGMSPGNSFRGPATITFRVITDTLTITETIHGNPVAVLHHRADE